MSPLQFRQLTATEFADAYGLVAASVDWLRERLLPAWLIPREVYYQRHVAGQNYGLLDEARLCAVVTLNRDVPGTWREAVTHERFTWLGTLASSRVAEGKGYGGRLLWLAEEHVRAASDAAIYLDCYYGDGRLPRYYRERGYELVVREDLVLDDGSRHDCVLMRKVF